MLREAASHGKSNLNLKSLLKNRPRDLQGKFEPRYLGCYDFSDRLTGADLGRLFMGIKAFHLSKFLHRF